MADLLSQIQSLTENNSNKSTTAADQLAEAYKRSQQNRIDVLTNKQKALEQKQQFFIQLKSKIDSLINNIDVFTASNAPSKFKIKSVTSSKNDVLTATADKDAILGINSVKVNRLASNDVLITKRLNLGDTELFSVTGEDLTFKINNKEIKVSIAEGSTNEQAMKAIVKAINATEDLKVTASYVKDTSSTGRITLTAKETGQSNKIMFDDNGSNVLNALGLDNVNPNTENRTQNITGNQYAYYKLSNIEQLNSEIEINGLNISRESNSINDVLPGLTLNLLKAQETNEQAVTLTADVNTNGVENLINPILNSYNDLIKFLRSNNNIVKSESSVGSLLFNIRSLSSQSITPLSGSDMKYLTDIGIKINNDGTLSINDKTKLTQALKNNPEEVANLFTANDGFAKKLEKSIEMLLGDKGLIQSKKKSLGDQIEQTIKRNKEVTASIDRQAENLKKEYTSMLKVYLEAQSQYSNLLSNFSSINY
ncbi:MAG: flagellar filament capping protein FliD [Candidatus Kapabacteria bacterium]|nr:flagellar filament capping protein FliD [Candidatus Kapabacteria bacterium]